MRPFELFGLSHVATLLATAAAALAVCSAARRDRSGKRARAFEIGLAGFLLGATALYIVTEIAEGTASIWSFLPFHLCDAAIFVAVYALLTRRRLPSEVLYFWAFAGSILAMVTPDLPVDFPSPRFFFYFGLHGGVVVAASYLTFGAGIRPQKWAPLRVWLITNAYAAGIALFNLATGQNYLYLAAKPAEPTLLDFFGPWPVYILIGEAVALGLFSLLHLLARRTRRVIVQAH